MTTTIISEARQRAVVKLVDRHCRYIGTDGCTRCDAICRALTAIFNGFRPKAAIRHALAWAQAQTDKLTSSALSRTETLRSSL